MASGQENGVVYLQFESANGSRSATPIEAASQTIGHVTILSATDRRQFYPLSYMHGGSVLDENGFLKLKFKPNAADIIESEESQLLVDVTLINKATGSKQPTTITLEMMTGFKPTGTIDVTLLANQNSEIAYWQVPAGNQLVLGHPSGLGKAYVWLGDDS